MYSMGQFLSGWFVQLLTWASFLYTVTYRSHAASSLIDLPQLVYQLIIVPIHLSVNRATICCLVKKTNFVWYVVMFYSHIPAPMYIIHPFYMYKVMSSIVKCIPIVLSLMVRDTNVQKE